MSNEIMMSSGRRELSPVLEELVDQCVDLMKVSTVQGLAGTQAPDVFRIGRSVEPNARRNPGRILSEHLQSRRARTAAPGTEMSAASDVEGALTKLYDSDVRRLVRRYNVDMAAEKNVFEQAAPEERFAFAKELFTDTERFRRLASDTYDTRIESGLSPASIVSGAALGPAAGLARRPQLGAGLTRLMADTVGSTTIRAVIPSGEDGGSGTVLNKGLELRLHEVRCIDETNPEWPGSDEISMGAVLSSAVGVKKVDEFRVGGGFDDGDRRTYSPPRILHRFDLDGAEYPANFHAVLALAEKDSEGLSGFLKDLWEAIKDEVTVILTAVGAAAGAAIGGAAGGGIGTAIAGPLGTIIGVVAGMILGAIVGWLVAVLKDDIFTPQEIGLQLEHAGATFTGGALSSPTESATFSDHGGKYRVYYSWAISR